MLASRIARAAKRFDNRKVARDRASSSGAQREGPLDLSETPRGLTFNTVGCMD